MPSAKICETQVPEESMCEQNSPIRHDWTPLTGNMSVKGRYNQNNVTPRRPYNSKLRRTLLNMISGASALRCFTREDQSGVGELSPSA